MEAVYAVTKLNIKPLLHIALTVLIGFHSMKSAVIPANIESSSVVFFGQNFLFLKRQRLILKFIPLKRSFFNQPTLVSLKNSVSVKWEYFSYFNSNNQFLFSFSLYVQFCNRTVTRNETSANFSITSFMNTVLSLVNPPWKLLFCTAFWNHAKFQV